MGQKAQRVNDPIRPSVIAFLEFRDKPGHSAPAIETQHERYILEQNPLRPISIEKAEDVIDKPRLSTSNARSLSSLAQVLTRKSCCHNIDVRWQRFEIGDVSYVWDTFKSVRQHLCGGSPNLRKHSRFVPSLMQAKL
jgi:hypothetical protein